MACAMTVPQMAAVLSRYSSRAWQAAGAWIWNGSYLCVMDESVKYKVAAQIIRVAKSAVGSEMRAVRFAEDGAPAVAATWVLR